MNKPPDGWKFTGRYYPDGAKLEMHTIHKGLIDLVWWHEERQVWIYLSTKKI